VETNYGLEDDMAEREVCYCVPLTSTSTSRGGLSRFPRLSIELTNVTDRIHTFVFAKATPCCESTRSVHILHLVVFKVLQLSRHRYRLPAPAAEYSGGAADACMLVCQAVDGGVTNISALVVSVGFDSQATKTQDNHKIHDQSHVFTLQTNLHKN
jgi:hypothetical protein